MTYGSLVFGVVFGNGRRWVDWRDEHHRTPLAACRSRGRPPRPVGHLPASGPAGHPGPPLPRPAPLERARSPRARSWPSGSSSSSPRATTASTTSSPGSPSTRAPSPPCWAKTVRPTDAHDDRLADWLTRLGAGDRLQRPGAGPEPADHPRLPAPHRPRPHRRHHRQLLRRGPLRAGALAVRPQQGRPRPTPAQDRGGRPRPAGPAAGHGRRARQHGRRSVVCPGHPGGATVPRGGRPDLRGRLQDGRAGHARLRGGRRRLLPVPARRRPSSAGPSGGSCCGRSGTALRRCSRCGDPASKGNRTNWWRRGSRWTWS